MMLIYASTLMALGRRWIYSDAEVSDCRASKAPLLVPATGVLPTRQCVPWTGQWVLTVAVGRSSKQGRRGQGNLAVAAERFLACSIGGGSRPGRLRMGNSLLRPSRGA